MAEQVFVMTGSGAEDFQQVTRQWAEDVGVKFYSREEKERISAERATLPTAPTAPTPEPF
jgi:hypothetical protein